MDSARDAARADVAAIVLVRRRRGAQDGEAVDLSIWRLRACAAARLCRRSSVSGDSLADGGTSSTRRRCRCCTAPSMVAPARETMASSTELLTEFPVMRRGRRRPGWIAATASNSAIPTRTRRARPAGPGRQAEGLNTTLLARLVDMTGEKGVEVHRRVPRREIDHHETPAGCRGRRASAMKGVSEVGAGNSFQIRP